MHDGRGADLLGGRQESWGPAANVGGATMRGWNPSVGIGVAAAAVVVVALILVGDRTRRAATMAVTVADRPVAVARGSSLGTVVSSFALDPRAGDLLDVHGRLLRADAVPGGFL